MDIRDFIFNNNNLAYTAQYGWQKEFGDISFTFGYINSYKEAADVLVEERVPDLYIFPIMFCYRQYLELLFKNICQHHMKKKDYKDFVHDVSHDLSKIWPYAKSFLISEINNDMIDFIEQSVMFFYALDPNSYTFRYEKDKKLKRSIKQDFLMINTLNLKEYIDKVDLYLRYTYDSL